MTTQNATIKQNNTGVNSQDYVTATYAAMANGDTGGSLGLHDYIDRTLQFTGTFGAAGSVSWEGSNDGVNWFVLQNPNGTLLTLTAPGLMQCNYTPLYSRPHVTAGDGTTSIICVVTARRFRSE
jgi:hypothetical protein